MVKWPLLLLAAYAVAEISANQQYNLQGQRPQAAPAPPAPKNLDCRSGGSWVFGCSNTFYQCAFGVPYRKSCQTGLVFDPDENRCEYPVNTQLCLMRADDSQPSRAVDPFSCQGKRDGIHGTGKCDIFYILCNGGTRIDNPCPEGLYYNVHNNQCDYKRNVPECKAKMQISSRIGYSAVTVATPTIVQQSQNAPAAVSAPGYTPMSVQEEITLMDCSKLPDGLYNGKEGLCSKHFWKCVYGEAHYYRCPAGLFYNTANSQCDFKTHVVECGGSPPPAQAPPAPVTDAPHDRYNCISKEDGFYTETKCSAEFIQCSAGVARRQHCPQTLVFNYATEACDYPENCGKKPAAPLVAQDHGGSYFQPALPPPPAVFVSVAQAAPSYVAQPARQVPFPQAPPAAVVVAPMPSYSSQPALVPAPALLPQAPPAPLAPSPSYGVQPAPVAVVLPQAPPPPAFDCSSRPDGFYEAGFCLPNYIRCSYGTAHAHACQSNLVFKGDRCLFVNECKNPTSPPPPPPPAQAFALNSYAPVSAPVLQAPPAPIDNSCANLADGTYARSTCSQDYLNCWKGAVTYAKCTAGLFFNSYNGFCDYRANVPECNPGMALQAPTPAPVYAPPPPRDLWCTGKPDGFHAEGCNNHFYTCNAGFATKLFCPVGLFYDVDDNQCNHRDVVVACGGKKVVAQDVSRPPIQQVGYGSAGQATLVVQPAPAVTHKVTQFMDIAHEFDCRNRATGYYSRGCHSRYYSCVAGMTYIFTCPAHLKYSQSTEMCDYESNVPECGGRAKPKVHTRPSRVQVAAQTSPAVVLHPQPVPVQPASYQPVVAVAPQTPAVVVPAMPAPPPRPPPQTLFQQSYAAPLAPAPLPVAPVVSVAVVPQPAAYSGPVSANPPAVVVQSVPLAPAPASSYQPQADVPLPQLPKGLCSELPDGIYGKKCSQFYFVCASRNTYDFKCSDTEAFDEVTSKCAAKTQVRACGLAPLPQAPAAVVVATAPY